MEYSKDKLNKWDVLVSLSSGVLTSMIDVFMINDISLRESHDWGKKEVDAFVIKTARSKNYNGDDLEGAVRHLEGLYPIQADKLTTWLESKARIGLPTTSFGGGCFCPCFSSAS